VIGDDLLDPTGLLAQRFDATPGATYLLRPDQHLAARWRTFDAGKIAQARARALEHDPEKWEPVFGKDHAQTKR
jgi:3-(3-hydroxy-phenyl)propionate hydroxylase